MSYVIKSGETYRILSDNAVEITTALPPLTYTVKQNPITSEFFLEEIDQFNLPSKLYGDTLKKAMRVLNTFENRTGATGVHLDGVKGSGKTLLAKTISVEAAKKGLGTIVVNQPFCGDEFNAFVQRIDIPAVIIFDEFEKVYNYDTQNKILTLFDGVYPSKKLFIITTNDAYSVSSFLKNRPGRIYYSFKYDSLSQDFIREYLEDNLVNKANIDSVIKYTAIFSFFNFDMLAAAVEEMNRYNETLHEVLDYLNIIPENKSGENYIIKMHLQNDNIVIDERYNRFSATHFELNFYKEEEDDYKIDDKDRLFLDNFYINVDDEGEPSPVGVSTSSSDSDKAIVWKQNDLVQFDSAKNRFIYEKTGRNGKKLQLTVERIIETTYNYKDLF